MIQKIIIKNKIAYFIFISCFILFGRSFSGLEVLNSLSKTGTVIIKHANPSGVSIDTSPLKSFQNALSCDPVSADGGVVVCNFKINKKLALMIKKNFLEVILAKGFDPGAHKILKQRKNLRIIDASNFELDKSLKLTSTNEAILIQSEDTKIFKLKTSDFIRLTKFR